MRRHSLGSELSYRGAITGWLDPVWRALGEQSRNPSGVFGSLVGRVMACVNDAPNRLALKALHIALDDTILEIGFGSGCSIAAITAQVPRGRICGIDQSAAMIKQAARRNSASVASGHVELVQGDFHALPWDSGHFDKILLVNVIYFFDPDGRSMLETFRVLKPRGRLVIYATDRSSMMSWPFVRHSTHNLFNQSELRNLLETVGFDSSQITIEPVTLSFGVQGLIATAIKNLPD